MAGSARVTVVLDEPLGTISPFLYGHFAEHLGRCIDEGFWVGEDSAIPNDRGVRLDTIAALRDVGVSVLRWPGGCFADDYHWQDGIGPREQRPRRVNLWWPKEEDNQFGTDEYLHTCRLLGAEPYIAVNVGSGTVNEALAWMQYCNDAGASEWARRRAANGHPTPYNVRWWGIGNENWGCGGQFTPDNYGHEYRRYANYLRRLDRDAILVGCGHISPDWNPRFLAAVAAHGNRVPRWLDHLSIHHYYRAGDEVAFDEADYYNLMVRARAIEADIVAAADALAPYQPAGGRRIGVVVDEWGAWHASAVSTNGLEQINTLRDAIAAAAVLDLFHCYAATLTMANLAQIVNVLQCLLHTDGSRLWTTPTYHLFRLYMPHAGGAALRAEVEVDTIEARLADAGTDSPQREDTIGRVVPLPLVGATASLAPDGRTLTITVTNRHRHEPQAVHLDLRGQATPGAGRWRLLTGDDPAAYNTAAEPERIGLTDGPASAGGAVSLECPPHSVASLTVALT